MRYWIGVASLSHVMLGVAGGFAQLGHGKAASLRRMSAGDWLVYYSPRTALGGGEPLQAFTAIARVTGDSVYPHAMSADFVPFRRDVVYVKCRHAPIAPLVGELSFIKDPSRWGYPFRRGHIEITEGDWLRIARAMGAAMDG